MDKLKRNYAPLFIAGTAVFFLATAYRFVFKKDAEPVEQPRKEAAPTVVTDQEPQNPVAHPYG